MARFFKFTADMAEFLREHLTLSEWKLWSYFATLDPFGKNYVELPDLVTILMNCGISERTFYRAIAKFKELELFDFQYDKAYIRNLNGSDMDGSETVTGDSGDDTDGSETVTDGTTSIYKEFKTLSDCPEGRESEEPEGPDNPGNVAIAVGVVTEVNQVSTVKPINSGEDKFSGARTGKTIQQRAFDWLPLGPWNLDGKLDPNFRDWLAGKWIADYGKDIHTQRANVLAHFKKDPANLPIRWEQYQGEYLDRFTNAQILVTNGVEIKPEYQETLIANQRAITQSLPQEMELIASLPSATVTALPIPQPQAHREADLREIAPAPVSPNGENSQAYKLWKAPKPVEAPITPDQWEETRKKLAALTGKFSFGKPTPKPLDNSLEGLNQQLHDPALREAAIAFAKNSPDFKYCPNSNEIITCEEF